MMRHVKDIKILIEQDKLDEAFSALDSLLSLGPKNIEALKIKAFLLSSQGKFKEVVGVWRNIVDIDPEDEDAILFFRKAYLEERENFYFTDELPKGGRRFIAYPRTIVNTSFVGLLGCGIFLLLSNLSKNYPVLALPAVSLSLFALFVFIPWVMIIISYVHSLREVLVTKEGIKLTTLLKNYEVLWSDIASFYLTYNPQEDQKGRVSVVFVPKNESSQLIELDVGDETSAIRAPNYFLSEVIRMYGGSPQQLSRVNLKTKHKSLISF